MVRINWTIQAKSDLKSIADYIAKDSTQFAKLQVVKIRNRTQVLKSHIRVGRVVPEINKKNIRELIMGNYRIIYKIVTENQIDILTVYHSARDLSQNVNE